MKKLIITPEPPRLFLVKFAIFKSTGSLILIQGYVLTGFDLSYLNCHWFILVFGKRTQVLMQEYAADTYL